MFLDNLNANNGPEIVNLFPKQFGNVYRKSEIPLNDPIIYHTNITDIHFMRFFLLSIYLKSSLQPGPDGLLTYIFLKILY
jgi:hypothetical protein